MHIYMMQPLGSREPLEGAMAGQEAFPADGLAKLAERQLWIGNIPAGLEEAEVLDILSQYQVRPYRLVLRQRSGGGGEL